MCEAERQRDWGPVWRNLQALSRGGSRLELGLAPDLDDTIRHQSMVRSRTFSCALLTRGPDTHGAVR
jgi:hypothetical protein